MDEFLFQLGNVMLIFFFVSVTTAPFLILITGRYMDKQLGYIAGNKIKKFDLLLRSKILSHSAFFSMGIVFNRFGEKSLAYKIYGDLKIRDYARPIDKFLSFVFWGSWGLTLLITLIWFIVTWFVEGNELFVDFFNYLTGKK